MEFDQYSDEHFDESISIREVVEKYTAHTKWFVLSVIVFLALAFLKVRYEVPKYKIDASILIKEPERGRSITDLQGFEDLGLFGMGDNNLQNEMQILKSRKLMTQAVKELNLNTRYFIEDTPYDREIFPNYPVVVHVLSDSATINKIGTSFEILVKNDQEFEFIDINELNYGNKQFSKEFKANLGNEEIPDQRTLSIELNKNFNEDLKGKKIRISIAPVDAVVNYFMTVLNIEPVDERMSNVVNLSIEETVKNKGIALINNLIEQYNADGINDKNMVAQTTIDFLNKRLELISTELSAIEGSAAKFKSEKGLVDVNTGASIYLQSSSAAERDLVTANTQLELVNFMMEELNNSGISDPLPGNIGLSDPSIVNMIAEYNNLILKRNRIIKSSSKKNPAIVNIDSQLAVLRNNLKVSLVNLRSSSQIQINALSKNRNQISSKIASVPGKEKEFKEIVRQQETKNALYLFLLQKREESILSNAVNIAKAKVIDKAYSNGMPVSPKKILNYIGGIILGFLIPFLIIYIKDLLDTKVHDEKDLRSLKKIPYLGDVPWTSSKKNLYINETDNSTIAEAFRYIRTNISFMLDTKEMGKTVFITSTQSHEGKTFTAINLASSLAISGKKTLLLAMDLRAPRISKYLGLEDMLGVTNYIKNDELQVEDIIDTYTKLENLDIINSGDIPPNPVELLMSKRVQEIFDYVKEHYEFIIVDTAPVGMVTDTIQISKFSDLVIYVIKANVLDKRMLHIPEKLFREHKLPKMAILINGSDHSKGAYGYGYGYGDQKKKPWYKRIF